MYDAFAYENGCLKSGAIFEFFPVFSPHSFAADVICVINEIDHHYFSLLRDLFLVLVVYGAFAREKKWVNVGPSSCTLKVYKWVPGEKHASLINEAH